MTPTYPTGLDALTREIDADAARVALRIALLRRLRPETTTDHGPTCCGPVARVPDRGSR